MPSQYFQETTMANFVLTKNNNIAAGVNPIPGTDTITVYDSGSIVTIPQPGQSTSPKLVDGTQQAATTAACDSTVPGGGNFINGAGAGTTYVKTATYGPAGNSLGYSILGE
jgi:hypothetical protein